MPGTVASHAEHSVAPFARFDEGPGRYRIGLLVLSNDYVTERDFARMCPPGDVAIFASRVPNTPECTVETLRQMAPKIAEATALLVPDGRLDTVAYSCTSGTAVLGFDAIEAQIHAARPGVACVTPLTASLSALERFGARRIAVLTPYVTSVNQVIARYLIGHGLAVVSFSTFGLEDNEDMAALSPDAIFEAALAADRAGADALFISCTAIRAVEVVDRIEQALGKPVVTAVQALFWQSLLAAGVPGQIPGYGRLLRAEY